MTLVHTTKQYILGTLKMKKRIRNPFWSSDFYLDRRLSPATIVSAPAVVSDPTSPLPGDTPPPPTDVPPVPGGPVGPASN
jgi:hypothetical protein